MCECEEISFWRLSQNIRDSLTVIFALWPWPWNDNVHGWKLAAMPHTFIMYIYTHNRYMHTVFRCDLPSHPACPDNDRCLTGDSSPASSESAGQRAELSRDPALLGFDTRPERPNSWQVMNACRQSPKLPRLNTHYTQVRITHIYIYMYIYNIYT